MRQKHKNKQAKDRMHRNAVQFELWFITLLEERFRALVISTYE
jgi:hypothetical protein